MDQKDQKNVKLARRIEYHKFLLEKIAEICDKAKSALIDASEAMQCFDEEYCEIETPEAKSLTSDDHNIIADLSANGSNLFYDMIQNVEEYKDESNCLIEWSDYHRKRKNNPTKISNADKKQKIYPDSPQIYPDSRPYSPPYYLSPQE